MTLKQKFMDLGATAFPTPVGFVRDDERRISREVVHDGMTVWAVISDEGEDGFSLTFGDRGVTDYHRLTLDEAVERARRAFRRMGADDGARYYLPTVIPAISRKPAAGENDAREFTHCSRCLAEGECQQKYGAKPAYPTTDGDCVWQNLNAEMDSWEFQPRIVGASEGSI